MLTCSSASNPAVAWFYNSTSASHVHHMRRQIIQIVLGLKVGHGCDLWLQPTSRWLWSWTYPSTTCTILTYMRETDEYLWVLTTMLMVLESVYRFNSNSNSIWSFSVSIFIRAVYNSTFQKNSNERNFSEFSHFKFTEPTKIHRPSCWLQLKTWKMQILAVGWDQSWSQLNMLYILAEHGSSRVVWCLGLA